MSALPLRSVYGVGALVALLATTAPVAQPARTSIRGIVFVDRNGDGRRDADEPGLAGVVVSDQAQAVATAADGSYSLDEIRGYGLVSVSALPGYRAGGRFWRKVADAGGRVDFPLVPWALGEEFTFLHASDTHVSEQSVPRMRRLREIVEARRPAFVLMSGDLVRDALRVGEAEARGDYDLFLREIATFRVPVWTVPGNHEIFGIERHLSLVNPKHPLYGKAMYRELLGPDYYSFNAGDIHFVGLNTVDVDDLWYYGHVDEVQLAWLGRDLSFVPAGATVVTFNHVPFFTAMETVNGYRDEGAAPTVIRVGGRAVFRHVVSNALDVLAGLAAYRHTLALGGHMHAREKLQFEAEGRATRFYQTAAVVGPGEGPMHMRSGVTLYRVRGRDIDDGEFIPLDDPRFNPR